jgi:hypothetical protein
MDLGDFVVADETKFHQTSAQAAVILLLIIKRLLELISSDQVFLYQNFAKPGRHAENSLHTPRYTHDSKDLADVLIRIEPFWGIAKKLY